MTSPQDPALLSRRDFQVITDGGVDKYSSLLNDVAVAPFFVSFDEQSYHAGELPQTEFFSRLRAGDPHPTTSQPTPRSYAELYQLVKQAGAVALTVTISRGLSGSYNAAQQATALVPQAEVYLHDSHTLSAAQAFQVHAACTALQRGETLETAVRWMNRVGQATELFFTLNDLTYLQRGGRIGRVAAMLGGFLNIKPVVSVDKESGTYINVARGRSWKGAVEALAKQVTQRYGAGTPLRVALLAGENPADAEHLLDLLRASHPILWTETVAVNQVLAVHTGPEAVGLAVAPGPWPWQK